MWFPPVFCLHMGGTGSSEVVNQISQKGGKLMFINIILFELLVFELSMFKVIMCLPLQYLTLDNISDLQTLIAEKTTKISL